MLLAANASAIYPSLDQKTSDEVVRKEILRLNYNVEGLNWQEIGRYLRMTNSPALWSYWKVRKLIPKRVSKEGVTPGITVQEARSCKLIQTNGYSLQ